MNITLKSIYAYSVSLFEQRIRPVLMVQHPKIFAAVTIAFTCLGALCLVRLGCFKSASIKLVHNDEIAANKEKTERNPSSLEQKVSNSWVANLLKQETVCLPDGTIETGVFKEGRLDGKGKITFPDGRIAEGEFEAGKLKHGKITYTQGAIFWPSTIALFKYRQLPYSERYNLQPLLFPKGTIVAGEFIDERLNGRGTITLPEERVFSESINEWIKSEGNYAQKLYVEALEGEFKEGYLHGQGRIVYGWQTLEGEFEFGKFISGKLTENEGVKEGAFEGTGCLNGQGKHTWKDGVVEEGFFVGDRLKGPGTVTWTNGKIANGEFIPRNFFYNGKPVTVGDGILKGIITHPDGKKEEGTFVKAENYLKIIYELDGEGTVTYPDGRIEKGLFKKGILQTS